MKTPILAIGRRCLLIWGVISLVGILVVAGLVAYKVGPGNRPRIDAASPHDVRFVLNWCELGDDRIQTVVHSQVSARSLTGDHLDAYAIKISHVDIAELTKEPDDFGGRWYRGDQLPNVVDEAVAFIGSWHLEIPQWFPSEGQLRSPDLYVYPCRISLHATSPTAAELIFIRPSDRMVFYFGGAT